MAEGHDTSLTEGGKTGEYDNPSVNASRCHLPLHKGGFGVPRLRVTPPLAGGGVYKKFAGFCMEMRCMM